MGQVAIRPTITMPANPPANVAEWTQPFIISAMIQQGTPGDIKPDECKMVISIKSDGKPVCGKYTSANAPYYKFHSIVMSIYKEEILSHLGECLLKPGQYELCVEFFGFNNRVMGASCKPFTIADNKPENFTPPSLISPAEGKVLSEVEQKQPINFRWTPIVPKPRETVVYKVTVLEVKKGQTATEARNLGNKVYENKVENQTQLSCCINPVVVWPIAKDSKYAWYVEVLGVKGNLLGSSEVAAFSVASPCSPDYEMKDLKAVCGKDGKVHVTGNIIITPKSTITINQISLTSIKETDFSGASVPTSISVYPQTLTGSGNSYSFDVIINSAFCNKDLFIGYNINYKCATTGQTVDSPCADVIKNIPCCKCTTCDQVKWTLPTIIKRDSTITNNLLTLSGNINFGPQKVVKLSAEIVDFYWYVEGDCKKSNNNGYYFGNLASGNVSGFTSTNVAEENGIPLTNSRQIDFVSSTLNGNLLNGNINLNISLPPQTQLSCCTDCFRFCIRYTATFMENGVCKTCSIVKCYETKRKHGQTMYGLHTNQCGEPIRIDTFPVGELLPVKN